MPLDDRDLKAMAEQRRDDPLYSEWKLLLGRFQELVS